MTPSQKKNLQRLLAPRHIAFIGGSEALYASRQCAAGGFSGQIWGVNPKRRKLDEHPCFSSVDDLPEAPDAAFIAVPGPVVPAVVSQLQQRGAGGVVCYSAGFSERGVAGEALEQKLIEVSGDLALVGPNVFGLLNYIQGAHLWPYSHGGQRVTRGPAIISQSGMLSGYLLTNRRSVNFSYVIGAGNQSILGVEDYLEALLTRPEVTAFGIYLESLRDIPQFAKAAVKALDRNIPLVVLKVGRSDLAARTTLTHTGSLAGSDTLYQALFDRLGVVRVPTPSLMLETLNLLTIAGAPVGQRLAAFTCSGGDVAMLADRGEECGIDFKAPSHTASHTLKSLLPAIATVSNPLDSTTPLWGHEEERWSRITTLRRCGSRIILHRILRTTGTSTRPTHAHLCRPRVRPASRVRYAAACQRILITRSSNSSKTMIRPRYRASASLYKRFPRQPYLVGNGKNI